MTIRGLQASDSLHAFAVVRLRRNLTADVSVFSAQFEITLPRGWTAPNSKRRFPRVLGAPSALNDSRDPFQPHFPSSLPLYWSESNPVQLIWTCDLALNRCFTCSSHFGEGRACFQALQSNFNKGEQHNIDSRSKFAVNISNRVGGDTDTNTRAIKNLIQYTGRYVYVSLHSWTVLKCQRCRMQLAVYIAKSNIFAYIAIFYLCVIVFFYFAIALFSICYILYFIWFKY